MAWGSLTVRWLVVPRAVGPERSQGEGVGVAATRFGHAAAWALIPGVLLLGIRQLLEFRDPFATLSEDVSLLLATPWGRAWLWSLAASVAAVAGFLISSRGRTWGWLPAGIGLLILAAFPGATGHAASEEGGLRFLSLAADFLHVVAAGAWMGGLAVVIMLERHRRRQALSPSDSLLPVLVPAYSPVAMVSVATLVGTGSLASWIHLPTVASLWESGYGRLLALKLVLVAVVLALGAMNWRRLTPRLTSTDGPPALRRAAAIELAVGTLVLLVTAVLVRTSPMGQ